MILFWITNDVVCENLEVIQELGGDEVDEALLTFQSMDHGETPRSQKIHNFQGLDRTKNIQIKYNQIHKFIHAFFSFWTFSSQKNRDCRIRTCSFPVHAMIVSHYMNGAWFPKGGPLSLARPLVSTIFKGGGAVLVRAPVQQIQVNEGRVTGVRMKKKDVVLACRNLASERVPCHVGTFKIKGPKMSRCPNLFSFVWFDWGSNFSPMDLRKLFHTWFANVNTKFPIEPIVRMLQ